MNRLMLVVLIVSSSALPREVGDRSQVALGGYLVFVSMDDRECSQCRLSDGNWRKRCLSGPDAGVSDPAITAMPQSITIHERKVDGQWNPAHAYFNSSKQCVNCMVRTDGNMRNHQVQVRANGFLRREISLESKDGPQCFSLVPLGKPQVTQLNQVKPVVDGVQ